MHQPRNPGKCDDGLIMQRESLEQRSPWAMTAANCGALANRLMKICPSQHLRLNTRNFASKVGRGRAAGEPRSTRRPARPAPLVTVSKNLALVGLSAINAVGGYKVLFHIIKSSLLRYRVIRRWFCTQPTRGCSAALRHLRELGAWRAEISFQKNN
jgi:hypothetical protein